MSLQPLESWRFMSAVILIMINFLECTKQELEYLSSQIPQLQFALQDPEVCPFADYSVDENLAMVVDYNDVYDDETDHSDRRNAPRNLFREFYGHQVSALFLRP